MSARISSDFFTGALNSVFTNTQNFVPSQVMCYRVAGLYPAFEIQLPVGLDDNQASFNKTNFVAGQTASLNPFTISMLLQSGI